MFKDAKVILRAGQWLTLLGLMTLLPMGHAAAAEPVTTFDRQPVALKVDGTVHRAVVESSSEHAAAGRRLASLLHRVAPVTASTSVSDQPWVIAVGREHPAAIESGIDFDALHPYGYVMVTLKDHRVLLAGRSTSGTSYAVADFLKQFAGYRRFMPGKLGEIVPALAHIPLPAGLDQRQEPDLITFTNAGLWGGDGAQLRSWRTALLATHNLSVIVSLEKYAQSHPHFFPLIHGKRLTEPGKGMPWNPCVSQPELPQVAIEWARGYFQENPEALGFSVGVNDGGGDCQCDACLALEKRHGNRYIPFYNAVAKLAAAEFPGKLVGFIAYGRASAVPTGLTLEPNLYVEVVQGLRNDFTPFRQWQAVGAKHLGLYDYLYGQRYIVPRHYPRTMGAAWRKAHRDFGMNGAWIESFTTNWLYDGPRQYVLNELAWDLDADIDALLADYFERFYCEAAKPMQAFFERIETIYQRKADPLDAMADSSSRAMLAQYTADDVAYLDTRLAQAREQARDPQAIARVALFEQLFGLSRLLILADVTIRDLEATLTADAAPDAQEVIHLAGQALAHLKAAEVYTIPPADEKQIFIQDTANAFRHRVVIRPGLDLAADQALDRLTAARVKADGLSATRAFWKDKAQALDDQPELASLLLTQVYKLDRPGDRIADVWPGKLPAQVDRSSGPLPWKDVRAGFKGWAVFGFPNAVSDFHWDPAGGDGQAGRLRVGHTTVRGDFCRFLRVQAGERYRVTFRAAQQPAGRHVRFTIRWQGKGGWLKPEPIMSFPMTTDADQGLLDAAATFTVPDGATTALLLFGAGVQSPDQWTAFDRFRIQRIYAPSATANDNP